MRQAPIPALALALALLAPACDGGSPPAGDMDGGGTTGCRGPEDCPASAPRCLVDEEGAGACTNLCAEGGDCPSGECADGVCAVCVAEAGTLLPGVACGCSADCAGTDAVCEAGTCAADCRETGCPEGLECSGDPGVCAACPGDGTGAAGDPCECDAECGAGLECIGSFCGESCVVDETCGADQCGHELLVPPSCVAIDASCPFDGATPIGGDCVCNAACRAEAPLCLGFFAEGARGQVCSRSCAMKDPCAEGDGTSCCGIGGRFYCLRPEIATATGATCL